MRQVHFCHGDKDYLPNPRKGLAYEHVAILPDCGWHCAEWGVYDSRQHRVLTITVTGTFMKFRYYV